MGEQAEYMLNGDDCQYCGEHIGEGDGYPRSCAGCGGDDLDRPLKKKTLAQRLRLKRKRARQQEKRKANRDAFSTEGWTKLSEYHFRKVIGTKTIDYWPSTQKAKFEDIIFKTSDINEFIEYVEQKSAKRKDIE